MVTLFCQMTLLYCMCPCVAMVHILCAFHAMNRVLQMDMLDEGETHEVGDYLLLEIIGEGSFSEVALAYRLYVNVLAGFFPGTPGAASEEAEACGSEGN